MKEMWKKIWKGATETLLTVGGLNWLLLAWFKINLVDMALGVMTFWSILVYSLVGLSAIYKILVATKVLK